MTKLRRRRRAHPRDPRFCHVLVDANALDRVDASSSVLVDEFLSMVTALNLSVIKPGGVQVEIQNPGTPQQVRNDLDGIFTVKTSLSTYELKKRDAIRALMTGNAKSNRHIADADHIFEVSKYGWGILLHTTREF